MVDKGYGGLEKPTTDDGLASYIMRALFACFHLYLETSWKGSDDVHIPIHLNLSGDRVQDRN